MYIISKGISYENLLFYRCRMIALISAIILELYSNDMDMYNIYLSYILDTGFQIT